jgi:hypothetical protein
MDISGSCIPSTDGSKANQTFYVKHRKKDDNRAVNSTNNLTPNTIWKNEKLT